MTLHWPHRARGWILRSCSCSRVRIAGRQNRIDVVTPVAPELAAFGPHAVGVRQLEERHNATDLDILNARADGPVPRYTRTLTLEVWHPRKFPSGFPPAAMR